MKCCVVKKQERKQSGTYTLYPTDLNKLYVLFLADSFLQALVAEIEQNQNKLDECQTHSKQYCTSVKVRDCLCLFFIHIIAASFCVANSQEYVSVHLIRVSLQTSITFCLLLLYLLVSHPGCIL